MTDIAEIRITGLRAYCRHGVGAQERRTGAWFVFDLSLYYDASAAIASDDVSRAVDYSQVAAIVRSEAAVPSLLIEHLAARIRSAVRAAFPHITSGSVTVHKPAPPAGTPPFEASVTLHW